MSTPWALRGRAPWVPGHFTAGASVAETEVMTPFRDATAIVQAEVDSLARQHALAIRQHTGPASLYAQRTARIAFGVTGTIGAAVVVAGLVYGVSGGALLIA